MYGAALYRLRREDFGEMQHHDGVSPAWPVSYEEFEPYYTEAERLYQVHGVRGDDPTEPPYSKPYPYPPVSHEPRIQKLTTTSRRPGYQPFHAPSAVMLNEADMAESQCINCDTCDGYPCLVHAKSDAEVIAVRPALEHANVTLFANARGGQDSRPTPRAAKSTEVVDQPRARSRIAFAATSSSSSAGAANSRAHPAALSQRQRIRRAWRTARARSGAITCFTTVRPSLALSLEPQSTRFPEDDFAQRFLFRDGGFRFPDGQHPDDRQDAGGRCSAPMPVSSAPGFRARRNGSARRRFLADDRGLPDPDNRVTSIAKEDRSELHPNNEVPTKRLYERSRRCWRIPAIGTRI